jgi:hypothetical protein
MSWASHLNAHAPPPLQYLAELAQARRGVDQIEGAIPTVS